LIKKYYNIYKYIHKEIISEHFWIKIDIIDKMYNYNIIIDFFLLFAKLRRRGVDCAIYFFLSFDIYLIFIFYKINQNVCCIDEFIYSFQTVTILQ